MNTKVSFLLAVMSATFKRFGWGESRQYLANVGARLTLSLRRVVPNLPAGLRAGGPFLRCE